MVIVRPNDPLLLPLGIVHASDDVASREWRTHARGPGLFLLGFSFMQKRAVVSLVVSY